MNDDELFDKDVVAGAVFARKKDAKQYGILRKSGRYPYGSGKDGSAKYPWSMGSTQNKRNRDFLDYFDSVASGAKEAGVPVNQVITKTCQMLGISTTDYRAARSLANTQQKQVRIHQAKTLRDKGWSNEKIAIKMFGNAKQESTVRSLLSADAADKANALHNIAKVLSDGVEQHKYIDIGTGVEQHLGISPDRLRVAVATLKEKGYVVTKVQVDQLGTAPGNKTTIKVLAPPGTKYKDVNANKGDIRQLDVLGKFSKDNGRSILGLAPPLSISSKRVGIRYEEDGGGLADGVIYVRPGVKDLSLGDSHYAQVRIMVDNSHFLKGMAVYKNDLPKGVDLQFNTNKSKTDPKIVDEGKLGALKPLKTKKLDDGTEVIDKDNPFGAQLKPNGQILDLKTGKATSAMNIINEEGDWEKWSKNLSSQFLSKQSSAFAKKQLDETYTARKQELDEIMQLTNPTVRRKLLESFADGVDSAAVDLKAAALPGQASRVILPIESMKETEVYAPSFKNGQRVALVRYPHGGTFEIPELTVNNRHPDAKAAFGDHPPDAIGINPKVAKRLSGADFDGDSVIVLPQAPSGVSKIQTKDPSKDPALQSLADFDPQRMYPGYEGMKVLTEPRKQQLMGEVSNLITDMTIKGASNDKIARAVKHSMVVIDAAKHKLDYKLSEQQQGIAALKKEFQSKPDSSKSGGASTLISRAGSTDRTARAVKRTPIIDPLTGKKTFIPKGEPYLDAKTGKMVVPTAPRKKLEIAPDAFALTSGGSKDNPGTRIEAVYAEHSNRMKDLGDIARKEAVNTKTDRPDPQAAKVYANEVAALNNKLSIAIKNRPLERQAQVYANETVAAKKADYPDMDNAQLKRTRFQALQQARDRVGAGKTVIDISPQEWQAIQARAISASKLKDILDNADVEKVRALATPRQTLKLSGARLSRMHSLLGSGNYTQAEVAQQLGVSLTTLKNTLREGG